MVERVLPEPEKYASCPFDGKILEYYKGQFDSVFILLHPFLIPKTIKLEKFSSDKSPSKEEIIEGCEAISWAKILQLTDLGNLSNVDIGLRTSISGLKKELANETFANSLIKLSDERQIIHPTEGKLPPLLENQIFEALKALGHKWLWIGDEFATERKLHWIDDLIQKDEVRNHGCVFTHDHSLLVTTHWDSHCSFLCSSKEIIEQILKIGRFEGFYCTDKTEVFWGLHEI